MRNRPLHRSLSPRRQQRVLSTLTCAWALGLLVVAGAGWVPSAAHAATFPDLYTLTVKVDAAASPDVRTTAIQTAMQRLLERVTGQRAAALDPTLADLIANAQTYLRSYATLGGGQYQVGFIPSRVNQALMAKGWPVWAAERPLTLVWLAVDGEDGERALVGAGPSADQAPALAEVLQGIRAEVADVADERGLPVLLPLLDLEDLGQIQFADVWGGFDQHIRDASARYRPDAILVGRVHHTVLGDSVQWTLLRGTQEDVTTTDTVDEGLEWLADRYAQDFSIVGGVRPLQLVIDGVTSLDAYGRVMKYLRSLSSLERIDVEELAGQVLTLRVASRGSREVLARTMALSRVLTPAAEPSSGDGQSGTAAPTQGAGTGVVAPGSGPATLRLHVVALAMRG